MPTKGPSKTSRHVLTALAIILLAFLAGFFGFAISIASRAQPDLSSIAPENTGLVVLTGGSKRIAVALDLLEKKAAKRLLISGVHKNATLPQLKSSYLKYASMFDCCIDLDYRAENTVGNAFETERWNKTQNFQTLIIVTSAYHMPRALRELRSSLPGTELIGYSVFSKQLDLARWYQSPAVSALLFREYLKYILSTIRTT